LELDPSGWVYGCCANQLYPLGRIGHDRLTDLWGGPRAQVVREALSRWDFSVGCGSCRWHLEHDRMDPDAAVYDRYPLTSLNPPGPVAMTFALSNRCNLACVMCTPELSSTLRHQAGMSPLRSPYGDEFFSDLEGFLPGLHYAKFLGGEPFLIPEHHRVWDLMAQVGGPPRMQVTTNGTIWNDRVEMVLDTFAVDVTVSFDAATAATYEAIRGGSEFHNVVANMSKFAERCEAKGTEFRLCFCLMDRNWQELSAFLDLADGLSAEVSINVVSDVGYALHDLPLSELEHIAHVWSGQSTNRSERTGGVWHTQLDQLASVIAERRAGIMPSPRQAQHAPPALLELPMDSGTNSQRAELGSHRDRLTNWSGGGPVAELVADSSGTVIAVRSELPRLGLKSGIVGRQITDVLGICEKADGRPAWVMGMEQVDDALIRTFVLSALQPERGASGSVVRTVLVNDDSAWTMFIAEDRLYDAEPPEVPVAAPTR